MSTDIELPSDRQPSVAAFIKQLTPEIQRALPRGMDATRMARLALTVVRQSEIAAKKSGKPAQSLANCDPQSFAGALLTASALGLEPGVNGEAYLIPYRGECTLVIGYQGMAKLFWQHPLAQHLDAQAVRRRDSFDFALGLDPYLVHKPARGDRGDVTDFYAVAALTTGARHFVVLTVDEVRELRKGRVGSQGDIPDPMHWMERKTALRQLVKLLPKSATLAVAMSMDERSGSDLLRHRAPELAAAAAAAPLAINSATGEITNDDAWPEPAEITP